MFSTSEWVKNFEGNRLGVRRRGDTMTGPLLINPADGTADPLFQVETTGANQYGWEMGTWDLGAWGKVGSLLPKSNSPIFGDGLGLVESSLIIGDASAPGLVGQSLGFLQEATLQSIIFIPSWDFDGIGSNRLEFNSSIRVGGNSYTTNQISLGDYGGERLSIIAFQNSGWIDFNVTSACGIGSGGAGHSCWIGYAFVASDWFGDSVNADICYRNQDGRMLWGLNTANSMMMLDTDGLTVAGDLRLDFGIYDNYIKSDDSNTGNLILYSTTYGLSLQAPNGSVFIGKQMYTSDFEASTGVEYDYVFVYNGVGYVNRSGEAASTRGTAFNLLAATNNYLYIGFSSLPAANTFSAYFHMSQVGAGLGLVIEYSQGSGVWGTIGDTDGYYSDNTNNFATNDQTIDVLVDSPWAKDTVNSVNVYWVRISTTSAPTTTPMAYLVKPFGIRYARLGIFGNTNDTTSAIGVDNNGYVTMPYVNGAVQFFTSNNVNKNSMLTTSTDGYILSCENAADATATVRWSPRIRYSGRAWTGSVSQFVNFIEEVIPTSAATPTGEYRISSRIGTVGGAYTTRLSVWSDGGITLTGKTDTDIAVNFTATTNSGLFTWMEDEDYFSFPDDILVALDEKVMFGDTAVSVWSNDDGYLDLTADTGIRLNQDTYMPSDSDKLWFGAGNDMTIWYDGTNGNIKTSDVAASDLVITCGSQKTLSLANTVYEDVQFPIASGKVPAANYPTWETFTTNTRAYAFSVDDYIDLQADELPHGWSEGTTGHVHLHFAIKTAQNTGTNRYAKFTVYLAAGKEGNAWTELGPFTAEKTIPTGSSALQAFYLDMGDANLAGYIIGGQLKASVKRIAATGGTEYADDVYITQVGMHVETNTIGSRQETVK